MRSIVNRMLSFALFAALAVFAAFVALETAGVLAGRDAAIGPVDYRSAWQTMNNWNPSDSVRGLIYAGVALVGVAIVAFELRRETSDRTQTIAASEAGTVAVDTASLRKYFRGRLEERDWVRKSSLQLNVVGSRVRLRDRPTTSRPYDASDVTHTSEQLEHDLRRMGFEPDRVEITPRASSGRTGARVR